MKNIRSKETCGKFFKLESTGWRSNKYGEFINIKDFFGQYTSVLLHR